MAARAGGNGEIGAGRGSAQSPEVIEVTVPSDARFLELIYACVEQICKETEQLSREETYKIAWVVHEACVNVIEHAHHFQASKPLRLQVILYPDRLEFRVYDFGPGFDIDRVPPPDPSNVFERGRGILGIRQCMDTVEYCQNTGCNCLRMVREIHAVAAR